MSESIFVRIGHVGGHVEELQVFSKQVRSEIDALLRELNTDADTEHDRVLVSDQHGDSIEVCATGLMTFSTNEGLEQSFYRAVSADKAAEIVTDFLIGMFGEWWAQEFVADHASLPPGAPVFGPIRDPEADCFLHKAAYAGNLSVVRALVLAGHDVNRHDGSRDSPLVCAVLGGHLDVCELLLKSGADVTALSGLGTSLLRLADEHPAIGDPCARTARGSKYGAFATSGPTARSGAFGVDGPTEAAVVVVFHLVFDLRARGGQLREHRVEVFTRWFTVHAAGVGPR